MPDMIAFSTAMLQALAEFLATPPVFYLFGLVCFLFVLEAFQKMMGRR